MSTTADYTHYGSARPLQGPFASEEALYFEDYLTDDEVRAAIAPIPAIKIERIKGHSRVHIIATYNVSSMLTHRLTDLGRTRYAELAPIWEAEREAKFQEYYKSVVFDESPNPYV